jgi:hypothetical protein
MFDRQSLQIPEILDEGRFMMSHFPTLNGRHLAASALALTALTISACTSNAASKTSASSNGMPERPAASPTPTYLFTKVDDPSGTNNNVTGINDNNQIVGVYYGSAPTQYNSYFSTPNPTGTYAGFSTANFPDTHEESSKYQVGGTYIRSVSTTVTSPIIDAGYAYNPGGLQGSGYGTETGVWGVANNEGLWSVQKLHGGERGTLCIDTVLNGINHLGYAVGAYADTNISCRLMAFYDQPGEGNFPLSPVSAPFISEATGINDSCDVVGWLQVSASRTKEEGFYGAPQQGCATGKMAYTYTAPLTYQSTGESTQPLGINSSNPPQIVGSFTVGTGKNAVTHGFVLTIAASGSQSWQSIDDPKAQNLTMVSGINDNGVICGWYNDSSGKLHGFVASPVSIHTNRRRQTR